MSKKSQQASLLAIVSQECMKRPASIPATTLIPDHTLRRTFP
jgi:hypothetical protein